MCFQRTCPSIEVKKVQQLNELIPKIPMIIGIDSIEAYFYAFDDKHETWPAKEDVKKAAIL